MQGKDVSEQRDTDPRLQKQRIKLKEVKLEAKISGKRLQQSSAPVTQATCV